MASDDNELLGRIQALSSIEWERPADLNRMSVEALFESGDEARTLRSSGSIRVFGAVVSAHQARLDAAGHVLVGLQKLVNATGASLRGVRSVRGNLPGEILTLTQLRLVAKPRLGSVVFDLTPESLPEVELAEPHGTALFDHNRRQFVDEAVSEALSLLKTAHSIGPDADQSEFLGRVTQGGPRVATALRDFASGVEAADFNVDFEWREPALPTARATFTREDAVVVKQLVASRDLTADPQTLTGTLITLSVAKAWQLDVGADHIVSVDVSGIDGVNMSAFHLGQPVTIRAIPTIREFPGGGQSTTFAATAIAPISDASTAN